MQGIHTTFQAKFFGALKHSLNFDIEKAGKHHSSDTRKLRCQTTRPLISSLNTNLFRG